MCGEVFLFVADFHRFVSWEMGMFNPVAQLAVAFDRLMVRRYGQEQVTSQF